MNLPVNKLLLGDCREIMETFPPESIDLVMFSPPYFGLRNYGEETAVTWSDGWKGQLGLEPDWRMYVQHLVEICRGVWRVLRKTGSMYINIGDTYAGSHCGRGDTKAMERKMRGSGFQDVQKGYYASSIMEPPQAKTVGYKPKCLMGIPWRLAFALIDDGWILRNDIIWYKPNHMPSSVKDRLTNTYEHVFHFVKQRKYYYNLDMVREPLKDKSIKTYLSSIRGKPALATHKGYHTLFGAGSQLRKERAELGAPKYIECYVEDESLKESFLKGLKKVYKIASGFEASYQSKYKLSRFGQSLQSFTREEVLARMCKASRIVAKELFPYNRDLQQFFVNWVHDHVSSFKGKNPGDMWSITTSMFKGAHFAVFPLALCVRPILSSCPPDGVVLDPLVGSGTTCLAAQLINLKRWDLLKYEPNETAKKARWNLKWIGIEKNPRYLEIALKRIKKYMFRQLDEVFRSFENV